MPILVEELSRKALSLSRRSGFNSPRSCWLSCRKLTQGWKQPWDEEIKRRIAEIDNGTAKLIPAEEVFAELRRLIK
ncbi:MAG: addiction module protein [Burkholderiaceae bacterium]